MKVIELGGLYLFLKINSDELLLLENANLHEEEKTLTARLNSRKNNSPLSGKIVQLVYNPDENIENFNGEDMYFERYKSSTETSPHTKITLGSVYIGRPGLKKLSEEGLCFGPYLRMGVLKLEVERS